MPKPDQGRPPARPCGKSARLDDGEQPDGLDVSGGEHESGIAGAAALGRLVADRRPTPTPWGHANPRGDYERASRRHGRSRWNTALRTMISVAPL